MSVVLEKMKKTNQTPINKINMVISFYIKDLNTMRNELNEQYNKQYLLLKKALKRGIRLNRKYPAFLQGESEEFKKSHNKCLKIANLMQRKLVNLHKRKRL
ncbi:hypothetical protein UA45_02235 [Morganella morganii]|uniref:Uncharacterized protein n=1 Tax=Morganella morganii TaxID=582 RepID=A0A0D8LCY9_MORMO|nr:hypothetical protein UA45_02235 [Morganella morganii]